MTLGVLEHIGVIWIATVGVVQDQQHPTDVPGSTVIGFLLYLAVGISILGGWGLFLYTGRRLAEVNERILWTGTAIAIAPLITASFLCAAALVVPRSISVWLPIGLLACPLATYLMTAAWLRWLRQPL
jgi:hypothetical protein